MARGKALKENAYRILASVPLLRRFFAPDLPASRPPPSPDQRLRLEIVSHCWRYDRLLTYQLSSLALAPPREVEVRITVFHSQEDEPTVEALHYFQAQGIPGVEVNPWPLDRGRLFRRAIGRNLAARQTEADWIWFTDCDILFGEGALDRLGREVRDRQDFLVFPRTHMCSPLLPGNDPIFRDRKDLPGILTLDTDGFEPETRDRAVGGFQIVRSDVARAAGYCGNISFYQEPVASWQKSYEDRTFRWLLGTQGTPMEVDGFYRIRHQAKGRKGKVPGRSKDRG